MDIRHTRLYKGLTPYKAVSIAEGFADKRYITKASMIASWQYIYDTGLSDTLQGVFGRTCAELLRSGIIKGTEY